jgi:hypothetical protein
LKSLPQLPKRYIEESASKLSIALWSPDLQISRSSGLQAIVIMNTAKAALSHDSM